MPPSSPSWPPFGFMSARPKRAELFLASVGFMPAGPRLAATGVGPQFPREPSRSTIRVAAFQTAIEYEYRPLRRTEYRFAEHEYDEIRCEARKNSVDRVRGGDFTHVNDARSSTSLQCFVRTTSRTRFDLTWRFDPKARNFRANRLGRQSASPHFKQPASTSTVR